MKSDEFLPKLKSVYQRSPGNWSSRCPAHDDRSPSLSISEGDKGLLIKCWAGCTANEVCRSLGIELRDLFYEALDLSPSRRREAAQHRDRQRHVHEHHAYQQGTLIDAMREADYFVRSRRGIDISGWNDQKLHDELNALADAYHLLENEDCYECYR